MGIKDSFERAKGKRKTKRLKETEDEEEIVAALPANEDNSNIDIQAVVESMSNPEDKAKVVKNNLKEIIGQNSVKSTLQQLPDKETRQIVAQNARQLRKTEKIQNAIYAIDDTNERLKAVFENIENIDDFDLIQILEHIEPVEDEEQKERLEQQKIKIISMKLLDNMIKYENVWHLDAITKCLKTNSNLLVIDICLHTIKNCEGNKSRKITPELKQKFVVGLLNLMDISYDEKMHEVQRHIQSSALTSEEGNLIKEELALKRLLEDAQEQEVNLNEVMEPLNEQSKNAIVEPCLKMFCEKEIKPVVKIKFIEDFFHFRNMEDKQKFELLDKFEKNDWLDFGQVSEIKMNIVSNRILDIASESQGEWNLEELTAPLQEHEKVALVGVCLRKNETRQEKRVTSEVKTQLIDELFALTSGNSDIKQDALTKFVSAKLLQPNEASQIIKNLKKRELAAKVQSTRDSVQTPTK